MYVLSSNVSHTPEIFFNRDNQPEQNNRTIRVTEQQLFHASKLNVHHLP